MTFKKKMQDILLEAVEQTFKLTLDLDVKSVESNVGAQFVGPIEFVGVMRISSAGSPGVFLFGCCQEGLLFIHEKMYPKNKININEKCLGIVSELTNIIYGKIKSDLNAIGFNFDMGFPVVISADSRDYFISHVGHQIYQFQIGKYLFYVSMNIEKDPLP